MDRADYRAQIESIVATWSQTSDFMGARAQAAEAGMVLRYLPPGASNDDIDAIYPGAAMLTTGGSNAEAVLTTVDLEQQARVAEFRETIARIEYLVHVLEPMNGVPFVDVTVKDDEPAIVTGAGTRIFAVASPPPPNTTPGGGFLVGVTIPPAYVPISQTQLDLLEQSYAELIDSVYDGLLLQTRLKPYLDAITLEIDAVGLRFDLSGVEALFGERAEGNRTEAIRELSDLLRVGKDILSATEWDAFPLVSELIKPIPGERLADYLEGTIFAAVTGNANGDGEDNILVGA
ncbi:MAG: hypothetical protein LBF93_07995, partial [Zoogloeaceae bacterium]|nr:hypothetical protein [Zoogloeaceae bacterium]